MGAFLQGNACILEEDGRRGLRTILNLCKHTVCSASANSLPLLLMHRLVHCKPPEITKNLDIWNRNQISPMIKKML